MAAGNWNVLIHAKTEMMQGNIDFSGAVFRAGLWKGTANLSNAADYSTVGSITNPLASIRGYGQSGHSISNTGIAVTNTTIIKFSGDGLCWSADGGNLGSTTSLQYAVFWLSGAAKSGTPIAYVTLSTAAFAVGNGSALQINGGEASGAEILTLT